MDRSDDSPMTVAQAKHQLLDATSTGTQAATNTAVELIRRHPLEVTIAAAALGIVLGISPTARRAAMSMIPGALMKIL